MTSMRTHYLVLVSCICLIVFLCWGAWFVYRYEAYELTVSGLILAVFVALYAHDELHIIRRKRKDRFKQPLLTTERG